jgi:TetR/AcrR family transcriptional repressor of bet genes
MAARRDTSGKRAASRARRRQQLVGATIKCIARKGIGSTTLADVAGEAGLSQGIVNLHFDSKDNLLAETLRYLAEDYDQQFMQTLEKSNGSAADKLLALMDLDLRPSICDRQKLAVWFAFWGEVKAVPTYQKICAARDEKYHRVMTDLVDEIVADGGYENVNAEVVTEALSSMTDGFWLSCLINPKTFDRKTAQQAVHSYLHATFPKHYPQGDV